VSTFRALIATEEAGKITTQIQSVARDMLPAGEVLVRIWYSSLNYKDGLAVTGRPGVLRKFPIVPGIDFAGTVEESTSPDYR
jgi:acrylyl-CoA reductase (NADPH)